MALHLDADEGLPTPARRTRPLESMDATDSSAENQRGFFGSTGSPLASSASRTS